jgi:hypothetical protein
MKRYDAVMFWLGGVLVPMLPELTLGTVTPGLTGHRFVHHRQRLRALAEEVALGKSRPADYCQAALELCEINADVPALEKQLIEAVLLRPPLATMIAEIPAL